MLAKKKRGPIAKVPEGKNVKPAAAIVGTTTAPEENVVEGDFPKELDFSKRKLPAKKGLLPVPGRPAAVSPAAQ